MVEAHWAAERRAASGPHTEQPPYSILCRGIEADVLDVCTRYGMGVLTWSPLSGGWLTGKYRRGVANPGDTSRATDWIGDLDNPKFERRIDTVEELLKLSETKGVPLARLANAWVLRHPAVTSAIIGPRTLEQLEDSLASLDVEFIDDEVSRIDELVQPGQTVL